VLEIGQGDDVIMLEHGLVARLERPHGQLLARKLARREVIDIARVKLGGAAEFVKGGLEMTLLLQLHTRLKLALGLGGFPAADRGQDDGIRCGVRGWILLCRGWLGR